MIEKVEASKQNQEADKGRARELKHQEQDRYYTESYQITIYWCTSQWFLKIPTQDSKLNPYVHVHNRTKHCCHYDTCNTQTWILGFCNQNYFHITYKRCK